MVKRKKPRPGQVTLVTLQEAGRVAIPKHIISELGWESGIYLIPTIEKTERGSVLVLKKAEFR